MNALDMYRGLKEHALPIMKHYQSDLDIDFYSLCEKYFTKHAIPEFIYLIRDSGTHIEFRPTYDDLPKVGERIPFLFGTIDRSGYIDSIGSSVTYFSKSTEVKKLLYWDGITLTEINMEAAILMVELWKNEMKGVQ